MRPDEKRVSGRSGASCERRPIEGFIRKPTPKLSCDGVSPVPRTRLPHAKNVTRGTAGKEMISNAPNVRSFRSSPVCANERDRF